MRLHFVAPLGARLEIVFARHQASESVRSFFFRSRSDFRRPTFETAPNGALATATRRRQTNKENNHRRSAISARSRLARPECSRRSLNKIPARPSPASPSNFIMAQVHYKRQFMEIVSHCCSARAWPESNWTEFLAFPVFAPRQLDSCATIASRPPARPRVSIAWDHLGDQSETAPVPTRHRRR